MYRRELLLRSKAPYRDDALKALDMAAKMSGWGTPLPRGTVRAIGLEERGLATAGMANIGCTVCTISIGRRGDVHLERVDIAHEEGFSLINPNAVRKQLEGQIAWFYDDAMNQEVHVAGGRIVENNFDRFKVSKINEYPREVNIELFKTKHWMEGPGHNKATTIQSSIAEAIFQVTGKRIRDLPFKNHDLSWA
jgi:CO/xanthine dehydrogenase Mo-binding subunit